MRNYIDGVDWVNINPMKYWAFPNSTPLEERKSTIHAAIDSLEYIGARKVDGFYQRIVKDEDGNIFMIARSRDVNGDIVDKHEWVPQLDNWFAALPNGTCLLCECYLPNSEGSKHVTEVLGCLPEKAIERQQTNPLHLYVFDVMAYSQKSLLNTKFQYRVEFIKDLALKYKSPYVEYAEYFEGTLLWQMLQDYLSRGYEGMVIMRKDALVYQKRTPARVSIKVKKELTDSIDCVILGGNAPTEIYSGKEIVEWKYWYDRKTNSPMELKERYYEFTQGAPIEPVTKAFYYGWIASFKLGLYNPDTQKFEYVGDVSNLTDEMKENWKSYVGRVVEIGAMEADSEAHTLRHPRLMRVRAVDEKSPKDCTLAQF